MNPTIAQQLGEERESAVDHPSHYQGNGLEVIDVIEAFGLGFCLGNAV